MSVKFREAIAQDAAFFLAVLGEFKRAVAAAQRYGELRRVGAATLTRNSIAPADIPRRIFDEFYSRGEVVQTPTVR